MRGETAPGESDVRSYPAFATPARPAEKRRADPMHEEAEHVDVVAPPGRSAAFAGGGHRVDLIEVAFDLFSTRAERRQPEDQRREPGWSRGRHRGVPASIVRQR